MIKSSSKGQSLSSVRKKGKSLSRADLMEKREGVKIGKLRRERLIKIRRLVKKCRNIICLVCWISVVIVDAIDNPLKTMNFVLQKYQKITHGLD